MPSQNADMKRFKPQKYIYQDKLHRLVDSFFHEYRGKHDFGVFCLADNMFCQGCDVNFKKTSRKLKWNEIFWFLQTKCNQINWTVFHTDTLGTSAANMFWKHCDKSRIVFNLFNYNYDCSFNYRDLECPYFWIPVNALNDICCRIVVCGKGFTK